MKLLILCLGHNVDLLLTTPVLRCLKQQLNNVEIHYLLQSNHKTILEANPYIERFLLHMIRTSDFDLLKDFEFDHIIDL